MKTFICLIYRSKKTITIIGNETGGRTTINLTVEKQDLETTPGVALQAQ